MKVKPWQLLIICVGLIIGVGSLVYTIATGETPQVRQEMHCIDVETGDLYHINTDKNRLMLPARHPTTGRVCLVRVKKDDQGTWHVSGRDFASLGQLDKDVKNVAVDDRSGELLLPIKSEIEYVKK